MPLSRRLLIGNALAFAMTAGSASAAPDALDHALPKAELRASTQLTFRSAINGSDYQIQIFVPRRPPPPGGYPTLYVLDGDALFASFAQAMGNRSGAHEIASAVVVGISGGAGDHGADRTYDFTFSDLSSVEKNLVKDLGPNPRFGGADQFYAILQTEIRPRVASLIHIDPGMASLLGWSLGGHFVMHTMFEHPDAFATFIALSPALWRSNRILFQGVEAFSQTVSMGKARPRLFLAVGSREEEAVPGLLEGEMTQEELAAELRYGRMVGNVRDMAERLDPIFSAHGMNLETKIFPGDTHNSAPWTAINPVLDFAFPLQR